MKKINLLLFFLFIVIFSLTACGKQPGPDWVSNFVVYQGNLYEVTQQHVEPEQIDVSLDNIKKLINDSKIHKGTFSNTYPKGTTLYKISNVDITLSIAVEVEKGQYLQADYRSKYGK